jgi:hypothetical protein
MFGQNVNTSTVFNVKLVVIHITPLPSSLASRLDNKAFYDKG